VRQTVLDALEHQDFPTLLLVERLKPARDLSRPPICQVMFVLDKPHGLAEQGAPTFVHGEAGPTMNSEDLYSNLSRSNIGPHRWTWSCS